MASTNVNVPTDNKIKEKDINAKLQLYGIFEAFAQGKVPSNKQIDVAMNTALEWKGLREPSKNLSSEGRMLVGDVRDVIEKTKIMLLSKNQGNLLQDFIYQTQHVGQGNAHKVGAPVDKDTAKQHGNEALEGLRTLGELIITNGQFRKLLSDATVLLRDIAGDAAQQTAAKVNPSEDELNQIDEPAEDNTWHEKPDFQGMKQNVQNKLPSKQGAKEDAQRAAGDATQSAHPSGARDPEEAARLAADERQAGYQNTSVDAKSGGKAGVQSMKENFGGRFDEDQKQRMREYREKTNNYFKEKVPKDRRDQTIYRLKKMIVEIQTHRDYQQAIDTLLNLAEEYAGHTQNVAQQGKSSAKGATEQGSVSVAQTDLKVLLERFANATSFDDLTDAVNQIYRDADNDPELRNWFKDMNSFIRRALKEQGYILEDSSTQEYNKLHDKGHFLLRERYRNHTDRLLDEVKFLANQFDQDPENQAFARSVDKLFKDLGNDQDGKPTFKPHLVKDLTEVLIPAFFENIRYVPIPRIEYSDNMIDAIVENLVVEGDNLAPNSVEFGSDNYWKWGRKGIQNRNKNKVLMSVSGIQMDLRDVAYYIKKKEGFPGITDKGVMDIFLGGSGLSFKVAMETADKSDQQHFFKINTVTVDIKNMYIKLKQSNHKLLFNLFKPILFKVMKPVIQKVVEKQVRDSVTQADGYLYRVKQNADRAQEEAKNNPDNAQNIYQRYASAFQREVQKGKEKKEANKQKAQEKAGQTNIALTQQDSMFKNISLPGGISTKATEYKQLADKGDKWESPVFSMGSARETTGLPTRNPTRKPHSATPIEKKGDESRGISGDTNQHHGSQYDGSSGYGNNTSSSYNQSSSLNQPSLQQSTGTGGGMFQQGSGLSGSGAQPGNPLNMYDSHGANRNF